MRGFARSVAVANGSVFIGEPANVHQSGIVYIYRRSGEEWSQQNKLAASDGKVGDGFGSDLSAEDGRILIGAPERNDERGAAYVFERKSDGSWSQSVRLALSDTSFQGEFGASVALHGDIAFIGAPEEGDDAGAVYVYKSNDNKDKWTRKATLTSGQVDEHANFGSTIGLRKDYALVGAPRHDAGSGAVVVYRYDSKQEEWKSTGRLVAYDGGPRYAFGSSLAFVGEDVWVGAPNADNRKGALYQFERKEDSQKWTGVQKIEGPDRERSARFAGTIAVDESIAVAGLVGADYGAGTAAILERDPESDSWSVQTTVLSEMSPVLKSITGNKVNCSNGHADRFGCENVDLLSFLSIDAIGGSRGVQLNNIWGWSDPKTGKEYALVGRMDGTSFVDVSNPVNPVYVGNLPLSDSAHASAWRDIKVYDNHAFIVSDNAGNHGMQVFDLTNLRNYEGSPLTFEEAAHYNRIHSAHNIVINKSTGYAYIVGSSGGGKTCGGGLHMVNIKDPLNPRFVGCFNDPSTGRSGNGYTHDAQCVTYHGPDSDYKGREICIGSNETAISIADVTNKENPKAISTASYPDHAYVHQGWLTENHRYFFQNDELDELTGNVEQTRTLVWDLKDLDNPQFVRSFMLDNASSDHNLYIKGDMMYESNYVSGLQVIDVSDPPKPVKVGHFDTQPFGEDDPGFAGTWSNYPFFDSNILIMTSMQEGLFILKPQPQKSL